METISIDRLRELEELEASIPKLIDEAVAEYKKTNLKKLHERDKANPEAINKRVKRYFERHKEEINARRREKRQKEKLEKQNKLEALPNFSNTIDTVSNKIILENPIKVDSIIMHSTIDAISKSEIPVVRKQVTKIKKQTEREDTNDITIGLTRMHNITVRFDT